MIDAELFAWRRRLAVKRGEKKQKIRYEELYLFFAHEAGGREVSYVESAEHWSTVVDSGYGMILHRPPLRAYEYWCTPINSATFAHTGGDGCHFGFLRVRGKCLEDSPVILTVPHAGACVHNVIVGACLREFIELGLRSGYFGLEKLATSATHYDAGHPLVRNLGSRRRASWVDAEQAMALKRLAKRFDLFPLPEVGRRLVQLQRRYLPKLVYSDEYREIMGL